jgi:hypothetical protein
MEEAVLQHQGNLEISLREVECFLFFVAYEVEAGESSVDVKPSDSKGMVVVPKRGGRLTIWIGRRPRVELRTMFAVRGEPCVGIAVVVG